MCRRHEMLLYFNPRPPRGGRRCEKIVNGEKTIISIHAPREGGDQPRQHRAWLGQDFNPRPPRGGRLMDEIYQNKLTNISIHAPREGGDLDAQLVARVDVVFQSTPPARGATPYNSVTYAGMRHFNPRPPRGGRHYERHSQRHYPDFNPRPPRGGRPYLDLRPTIAIPISIHAPREGGDQTVT